MKFQSSIYAALMLTLAHASWAMTGALPNWTINPYENSTASSVSERPVTKAEKYPCDPEGSVHFSKIPDEFLTTIASYLSPEEMAKLAEAGRVSNHIIALAASRLESFKLKKNKSAVDQLQFLLKGSGENNTRLKTLKTYDIDLTIDDLKFIINHFSSLENIRVTQKLPVIETLKLLLKNADGNEILINEKFKKLAIAYHLSQLEYEWIIEHFPKAKLFTPVTLLEKEDELYDALPSGYIMVGPDNIYQIRDPKGIVPPFILSHVIGHKMNHADASSFCAILGGRLPTKNELVALERAMTARGKYNPDLIVGMRDTRLWSSSAFGLFLPSYFSFSGNYGVVGDAIRTTEMQTRCIFFEN